MSKSSTKVTHRQPLRVFLRRLSGEVGFFHLRGHVFELDGLAPGARTTRSHKEEKRKDTRKRRGFDIGTQMSNLLRSTASSNWDASQKREHPSHYRRNSSARKAKFITGARKNAQMGRARRAPKTANQRLRDKYVKNSLRWCALLRESHSCGRKITFC